MSARFALAAGAAALVSLLALSSGSARAAGLLGLYSFNGTLNDSSGSGKAATATGTPTYVDGAPFGGKALSLDGSGKSLVTVPLNISVAALKQVTFGAWVNVKDVASPQYGIISNDNGGFDRSLDIDNRATGPGPHWAAFVGGAVVGNVAVEKDKWVFLAVSFDQQSGAGKYAFYVNDQTNTTVLTGADAFDTDSVTKGVTIGKNPNFDQPFHGEIANAFFYKGVLTRDQIEAIIAKGPSAIPGYKKPQ